MLSRRCGEASYFTYRIAGLASPVMLTAASAGHDRKGVMAVKEIGIIFNGATGRIGRTQHLANALAPIRAEGGLKAGADWIMPRLLLVGRDAERLASLAHSYEIDAWTTDLDVALANPDFSIFFDAAATSQRVATLTKAVAAGKHIYTEKPVAPSVAEGLSLLRAARARNLKAGTVEDKINLPGLHKLKALVERGFFGRVTGFQLTFGWWVFDGAERPSQRPSWNYQRDGGGGLTMDMSPHWRYVIEDILGSIHQVVTATTTAIPKRIDENGKAYTVDVDDTSVTLVQLASGVVGTITCSWATRVRRDDLLTLQIDGTGGSALAGLHRCWTQSAAETPNVRHFNPDLDIGADYRADWKELTATGPYANPYRIGWEYFLRHVVAGTPLACDLSAGIRDVQLADACYRSVAEQKWITLDDITT
jgi:predicted dehydrogenase